ERVCIAAGSLCVEPLCHVAHDATQADEARWRAATILGDLGDNRAAPTLIALCADESHDPRQGAIWALGWLRHAGAFESLLRVVNDVHEDEQVRFVAACSLLSVDTAHAYPLLLELSQTAPDGVRRAARAALANLAERQRSQEAFDHE
ncbi:MAG: HEAT repeat domain-containing protein, partial [Anaerolineae bacterium]|nr:HEAT repeat domain-containing protein [Anaerolineae bacterium]